MVAEKGVDDHLKPSSGDTADITTSQTHISANNDATDKDVAQVDDNDPKEQNHTIHEAEELVELLVAEKSPGRYGKWHKFPISQILNSNICLVQFYLDNN